MHARLSHMAHLGPAWATGDPVLKRPKEKNAYQVDRKDYNTNFKQRNEELETFNVRVVKPFLIFNLLKI